MPYPSQLEPGGYFEAQDMALPIGCDDGTLTEDSALWRWMLLVMEGMDKLGRPVKAAQQWKEIMEGVGFEDVVETVFKWPTNRWPRAKSFKNLGMWSLANMDQALEAATLAPLTRTLGWSKEEVMVLVSQARRVLRDPTVHGYWPMFVAPISCLPLNSRLENGTANVRAAVTSSTEESLLLVPSFPPPQRLRPLDRWQQQPMKRKARRISHTSIWRISFEPSKINGTIKDRTRSFSTLVLLS